MDRRDFLKASAGLSLSAWGMQGCSSGSGTTSALSNAQRSAALEAVRQKEQALLGQPLATFNQNLVAFMKSRPDFSAAGVSPDASVWGKFKDGRRFLSVHNEVESQTSDAASKQVTARVLHSTRAAGLPEKGNAFLFNAMEPYRTDGTAVLAAELTAAGYNVAPGKSGTVSDWMSVKDCGILVFHCHGGEDGGGLYALSTPEVQTEALDQKYKTLLDLGDLIPMNVHLYVDAQHKHQVVETHYGIAAPFIDKYISFAKNGFVYAQACTSDQVNIKNAFFNAGLSSQGASLYAGWSDISQPADSTQTGALLFDRLLGLNQIAPAPSAPPPMDFPAVEAALATTTKPDGYHYDQSFATASESPTGKPFTSQLVFTSKRGDLSVIIPSLVTATQNAAGTLTLAGEFGAVQGVVKFNGTPLAIKSWSPTSIVTALPTGTGVLQVFVGALAGNPLAFPALKITPAAVTLAGGANQSFSVQTLSSQTGQIVYDWSTNAAIAVLSDGNGMTGRSFETSSATVNLQTTPSDQGTLTVSVTVYQVGTGGVKTKIGDATATVTLSATTSGPHTIASSVIKIEGSFPTDTNGNNYAIIPLVTFKADANVSEYEVKDYLTNPSPIQLNRGTLLQADVAKGAPIFNNTTLDHLVDYAYKSSNVGAFYNLGGGLIGYTTTVGNKVFGPNQDKAQEEKAVDDYISMHSFEVMVS